MPTQSFGQEYALQRARQFLAETANMKMIRLTLVPDEKPAIFSAAGCDHCEPYQFWRGQWDAILPRTFPVAELMSIDGNSVLRYRDKSGNVSVVVLEGSDPRPIRVGGYQGRIVHVAMAGRTESPIPELYVVGIGTISSKDGASCARDVAAKLGVPRAWINFRADPWFISEIWTTFFPIFDTSDPVPAEKAFKKTKTLYCSYVTPTNNKCSWDGVATLP